MVATFIGIDIAWKSARNPSGVAVLRGDRLGARLEDLANLGSDASVAEYVRKHSTENTVVAIDGPLIIENETGQRPCEIDVSKRYSSRDAGCYPSNLSLLPNASSVALARELSAQGFKHVDRAANEQHGRIMAEVYPHAGMVALWDLPKTIKYKRGAAKRSGLQELRTRLASLYKAEPALLRTGVLKELLSLNLDDSGAIRLKDHEDRLDALFCAYLAYYFWYWGWERNEMFGDVQTGYILNPMLHKSGRGTGVPPVNVISTHVQSGTGVPPVNVVSTHVQSGTGVPPVVLSDHQTQHAQDAHATPPVVLAGPETQHAQDAHATSPETSNLKPETDFPSLIAQARALASPIKPSDDCSAGDVASVILSRAGNRYSGVSLDFACSLGFCAEHAAIAEMLKGHESEISLVVAVDARGTILPPCGRCREMMWQLNSANRDALVILSPNHARPLHELLPER